MDPLDHTHFHSVIRAGAASLPRDPEMRILSASSFGMAAGFHLVVVAILVTAALLKPESHPPIAIQAELILPDLAYTEPLREAQPPEPKLEPAPNAPSIFAKVESQGKGNATTKAAAGQNGTGLLPATDRPTPRPSDPWDFSPKPPKLAASESLKPRDQAPPPPPPVAAPANSSDQTTSRLDKSPQTTPAISGPVRTRITAPSSSSEGTVLVAPLPIYHPRPPYPKLAEAQGLTGQVVIRVLVSTEGKILKAEVAKSSGSNMLDEAARRGVMGWKFTPGRQASGTVTTAVDIPIEFKLDDGKASSR